MNANINAEPTPEHWAILTLPRLRVQNANAISSPMTWGFPSMTAFLGMMTGLERRMGLEAGIAFRAVGVVCHDFEAQVTTGGFTRAFHLTRNPLESDGSTAAIVEEGRVHLELTLVFSVQLSQAHVGEPERQSLLNRVAHEVSGMRLAGGSLMPPLPTANARRPMASLEFEAEEEDARRRQMRRLIRQCLPGFALVSRDALLAERLAVMRADNPQSTSLDAWLDLSRWNHHAQQVPTDDGADRVIWKTDERPGWTVPIPVGYTALSELHQPGSVARARDTQVHFRFVETIWSMGEWISPHRLKRIDDLFWYTRTEGENHSVYRCCNDYVPDTPVESAAV